MFQRFTAKFSNAKMSFKADGVICLTSPDAPFSINLVWLYANFRIENGTLSREKFILQCDLSSTQWYCDKKHVFGSHAAHNTLNNRVVTVCRPVIRQSRVEKSLKRGFTIDTKSSFKIGVDDNDLSEGITWSQDSNFASHYGSTGSYLLLLH